MATTPGKGLRNTGAGLVAKNYNGATNIWTDNKGRKVGTSTQEDSPVKALATQYVNQRAAAKRI